MITTLFFDLDGTLLPMDLEGFTKAYLKSMAKTMAPYGFDPQILAGNIMKSIGVMGSHDPAQTNEKAFWDFFSSVYGEKVLESEPVFETYYRTAFSSCQAACPADPHIPALIESAKKLGFRIILATNPIFPRIAVENRIRWAGLKPDDFEWITSYENSSFTKPDPRYFLQTAEKAGVKPENVLMIGNDLREDYGAVQAGMKLYILTGCLIPAEGRSVDEFPHGTVSDLKAYLKKLKEKQSAC